MRARPAGSDVITGEARPGADTIALELETYRRELTGYCYRMLGSGFEAEDAVQETMVRAWRGIDKFEGRSALRSWLYRIATNVCLDMLHGPQRRARPMDLGPSSTADTVLPAGLPEHTWVQPVSDARVLPTDGDPADLAAARDSIRLAFVAALQHLPPRQRAVLILREVLRWQASEVAELLDTSVASVNSALQRARATLAGTDLSTPPRADVMSPAQAELLARYVEAFERYDIPSLVALLRSPGVDDVVQADEVDEGEQFGAGVAQPDPAAEVTGGQGQAGQPVDHLEVGMGRPDQRPVGQFGAADGEHHDRIALRSQHTVQTYTGAGTHRGLQFRTRAGHHAR